jgi:hypothetical protein
VTTTPTALPIGTQIADLLAWARRLAETRHRHNNAEYAAYQAAKTELLARITATNSHLTED